MKKFTLTKLKTEGRLQRGDTITSDRLGECVVTDIDSTHTIIVRARDGKYYRISGLECGTGARLTNSTP